MLNFYANPLSPFATKVQYLLEELAVPYKYHVVNLRDDKAKASLRELNSFGKIPTIEHAGFCLGESNAILRYLPARLEAHSFYPQNLEARAKIDAMLEFTQLHVLRWLMSLTWNLSMAPKMGIATDEHAVEEARRLLPDTLTRLEQTVNGNKFLCGHELTIADVAAIPFFADHKLAQVSLADYPSLAAWTQHMTERAAWTKTHSDRQTKLAALLRG